MGRAGEKRISGDTAIIEFGIAGMHASRQSAYFPRLR